MGLLDQLDDPVNAGLLSMGLRLMSTPGRFGQALGSAGLGAMGDIQALRQQQEQRKAQAQQLQAGQLQMQMHQQQLAEMQRQAQEAAAQRARDDQFRNAIPSPMGAAASSALSGGGGPTVGNAAQMAPVDPFQQQLYQAMKLGQIKPMDYLAATKKDTAPIKLAAGEGLYQPGTFKPLVVNPKEDTKPSALKEYEYAKAQGYQGSYLDFALAQKKAGASNVSVSVEGQKEYAKQSGKDFAEMMAGFNKQVFTAPAQIRKLERMEQLLQGVDGGKLAPTGVDVASALNSMGIKIDPRLGNKEAAEALARDLAGGLRQPGTGPMTDKDFDNFMTQIPGLSKTAPGRAQIMTTMKAALNRDMKLSQLAREYERKHGQIDGGFIDQAAQFIAENPVVGAPQGWKVNR